MLTKEVGQAREYAQRNPYQRGCYVFPVDIEYSSSHEDFDGEEGRPRKRRHPSDNLRDLKVEVAKFDGNLNPEGYPGWVQAIEKIF